MDSNRISKEHYKPAVQKEKKKLFKQVIVLTILAGVVAGVFYATLLSTNPYKQ
jgi:hypothetical protein